MSFSTQLLHWYDKRTRPMPWRGEKDPYKIWLSEVMLQQTQVETVKPYYERWLKKFPTLAHVARAPQDDVLKAWEGLGYYARARNFHTACQQVVQQFQGAVPISEKDFSSLKGIGPYTLAAVFSIAFEKPIPTIDGNVKRVVARLLRINTPPSQALSQIEAFLTSHISKKRPGDFNQAMMDIGSTICRPQKPLCLICPLHASCEAFQKDETHRYPLEEKKLIRPHYKISVGIVLKRDKVLISKRKSGGLLGGLWEFPGGKIHTDETAEQCAVREVKEEVGVVVKPRLSVGSIKHAYTHFSIEMEGIVCDFVKGKLRAIECESCQWVRWEELSKFAFPKANHKLFPLLKSKLEREYTSFKK